MKLPLKAKAILMVVSVGLLIAAAGIIVFDRDITTLTTQEYEERSLDIARALAKTVNAEQVKSLRDAICAIHDAEDEVILSDQRGTPEFNEYISHYSDIENSEEFLSLREQLRNVQDVLDVGCLYIVWLDTVDEHYIYLVDGAYEDACPPGCTDPLFWDDIPDINTLLEGCPPNITHTKEYGYLMTTAMPVFTTDNELVGFAAVDISMNDIVSRKQSFLLTSVLVFGIATIIASLIGIYAVDRTIVRPINRLSETAETYTASDLKFSEIDIHTGDEIETLANSMKHMERDIKKYYENLMETKSDLETVKEYAEMYKREANVDPLTNLLNKRAYNLAVTDLEKNGSPYAIVMIDLNDLKRINDQYGHDKGDVAIKNLAGLICKVFKYSPSFRIGGDEFVVIMTDGELEAREGLIGHFRDEVRQSFGDSSLQPWEKTSAACGYAVYDAQVDDGAASVFKRADEDMYDHKVKMKKALLLSSPPN